MASWCRDIDLQEKPECSYVFGCGAEVPPQEESKVRGVWQWQWQWQPFGA